MGFEIEDWEDSAAGELYGGRSGGRGEIVREGDEALDLEVVGGVGAGFEGLGWAD